MKMLQHSRLHLKSMGLCNVKQSQNIRPKNLILGQNVLMIHQDSVGMIASDNPWENFARSFY